MNKKFKFIFTFILLATSVLSSIFATDYYYESLNKSEKSLYKNIKTSIETFEKDLEDVGSDFSRISDIYYFVLFDNPQLFYVTNKIDFSTITQGEQVVSTKIIFNYKDYSLNDIDLINKELKAIKKEVASKIDGYNDFEIVKYCFEYLVNKAYYNQEYIDQSLVSVLIENVGLCSSYAKSFKYFMDYFDIPCLLVEGKFIGSTENHVWNMVMLDNQWYHVDVTQADASNEYIDYSYLCVSEYQISKDHIIISKVPIFFANSVKFNYLNRVGCLFDSFDKKELEKCIIHSLDSERKDIIIGFNSHEAYLSAKDSLIVDKEFYNILLKSGYEITKFNYSTNDFTDVLVFIIDDVLVKKDIIYFEHYSTEMLEQEIIKRYKKGQKTFNLFFANPSDFNKAKQYLLKDLNIFNITDNENSLAVIYYDDIYRFDIQL